MFQLETAGWEIVIRTAAIYLALLVGLRLAGKREIGQMTPFDLVVILLIANAVQNAMVGPDTSLLGGLIAAGVLIGVNYGVAFASKRIPWLRTAVEGSPTILVYNGEVLEENMQRESIDQEELEMALRQRGLEHLNEVRLAVLEVDGSISIIPKEGEGDDKPRTTIVRKSRSRFLKKR